MKLLLLRVGSLKFPNRKGESHKNHELNFFLDNGKMILNFLINAVFPW